MFDFSQIINTRIQFFQGIDAMPYIIGDEILQGPQSRLLQYLQGWTITEPIKKQPQNEPKKNFIFA